MISIVFSGIIIILIMVIIIFTNLEMLLLHVGVANARQRHKGLLHSLHILLEIHHFWIKTIFRIYNMDFDGFKAWTFSFRVH